jgi:hypothetical protein
MASAIDKSTLTNLLTGPCRIVYAPSTVAVPVKLDDIYAMATPYALKAGWLEAGGTSDDFNYERDMDSNDFEIQQKTAAVLTKVTGVTRTATIPFAEITPALMALAEGNTASSVSIATGAGGSGTPAQTRVPFGSISSLPRYRLAIIAERDKGLGTSAEGGLRGQHVGLVFYSAAIAALKIGRDDLPAREVPFQAFPDPSFSSSGDEVGCFLFETGATVP